MLFALLISSPALHQDPDVGNKNANLHGLAFLLGMFLVARGGIKPPTQGFSIPGPLVQAWKGDMQRIHYIA
jgi:hypothetical protein